MKNVQQLGDVGESPNIVNRVLVAGNLLAKVRFDGGLIFQNRWNGNERLVCRVETLYRVLVLELIQRQRFEAVRSSRGEFPRSVNWLELQDCR